MRSGDAARSQLAADRSLIRLVTLTVLLTAMAFASLGWILHGSYRVAATTKDLHLRIEELRGVIVHLDEVLTNSARMAAATGEIWWEERYRQFEPQLRDAIRELKRLAPDSQSARAVAQTEAANDRLVDAGRQAFELVRGGRTKEAEAILRSRQVATYRTMYAEGIAALMRRMGERLSAALEAQRTTALVSGLLAFCILALSIAAWLGVMRGLRRWRAALLEEVTQRRRAEDARATLTQILEATPDFVGIAAPDGLVFYRNRAAKRLLGIPEDEDAVGMSVWDVHPPEWNEFLRNEALPAAIRDGTWIGETVFRGRDGREFPASQVLIAHRGPDGGVEFVSTVARDISAQRALEEGLRQAQKMEALGRLAGGIAHDFNNLLTAITSYSELLLMDLDATSPLREEVEGIKAAAQRAAMLTRQLLAFSRRQVLQPKVLDLNAVVANVEKMLRRVIGEDIELVTALDPSLGRVKADPGQIEQVIMNLAVNARDAMPRGGKLVIEMKNFHADQAYFGAHDVAPRPGAYVMLAVSDTGVGMTKEVQSHLFEPFFTTKEKGKGTGLGLSTAYGIVKQSEGYIWVYSELGRGTSFKIYLPRVEETGEAFEAPAPAAVSLQGSETVLLVEDDALVRELASRVLRRYGYNVLAAARPDDALRICERHPGPIHLIVSDVVMPQMSGREVSDRLLEMRPAAKVLYISGYTDDAIIHHGVLEPGTAFLQKPFTPQALARKVREVLSEPVPAA